VVGVIFISKQQQEEETRQRPQKKESTDCPTRREADTTQGKATRTTSNNNKKGDAGVEERSFSMAKKGTNKQSAYSRSAAHTVPTRQREAVRPSTNTGASRTYPGGGNNDILTARNERGQKHLLDLGGTWKRILGSKSGRARRRWRRKPLASAS